MELPEELVGIEDELDLEDQPDAEVPFEETDEGDADDGHDVDREQFVVVAVGDEELALHVNAVRRLVDIGQQSRVPRTSEAIDGITDLRGSITAVIDARVVFDVSHEGSRPNTEELVVFATGSEEGTAGITVDEVLGVRAVPVTHVVLDPGDVDSDRETVEELLSDPLVAGLVRVRDGDEYVYRPVVDTEAVLETARAAAT